MADLCVIKKLPSNGSDFFNIAVLKCQRKRRCVIDENTWVLAWGIGLSNETSTTGRTRTSSTLM